MRNKWVFSKCTVRQNIHNNRLPLATKSTIRTATMLQCTNPVKHILARRVATTTVRCTMYEIDEQNVNVQSQHPKLWSSTYMDQDIRTSPFHCWQPHPREYTSTGTSHRSELALNRPCENSAANTVTVVEDTRRRKAEIQIGHRTR